MFLDSFFRTEKVFTATIENKQQRVSAGVIGAEEWIPVKSVPCIFWRGSMADRFVDAQYRAAVSAVAIVKPSDISAEEIPDTARLTLVYGVVEVGKFSIVKADDVAVQGDCIVLLLTGYKD